MVDLEVFSCGWTHAHTCDCSCITHKDDKFICCRYLLIKNIFKED